MPVELVHSTPSPDQEQRILRIRSDALILRNELTRAEARAAYLIVERARDDLSAVLDRADYSKMEIEP